VAKLIFKKCELSPRHGWDSTILKFAEDIENQQDIQEKFDLLKKNYIENILTGNKSVKIFNLQREKLDELIRFFEKFDVLASKYSLEYPFVLERRQLILMDNSTKLVKIEINEETVNLVFCTKRSFKVKENIEAQLNNEKLGDEIKDKIKQYDEIVGIKKEEKQFFDIVVLWKNKNVLEVRVDIPESFPSLHISQAFSETISSFNILCKDVKFTLDEKISINLFPLISKFYKSENDGRICELGFSTNEGSIKHEKERFRNRGNLRFEKYHSAGVKAVPNINLFLIALVWDVKIDKKIMNNPELMLPGNSRLLSSSIQFLGEVHIRKCCGIHDYNFIINQLLTRLKL
jgi:hypothetical protein